MKGIVFLRKERNIRLLAATQRQPLRLTGVEARLEEGGVWFISCLNRERWWYYLRLSGLEAWLLVRWNGRWWRGRIWRFYLPWFERFVVHSSDSAKRKHCLSLVRSFTTESSNLNGCLDCTGCFWQLDVNEVPSLSFNWLFLPSLFGDWVWVV